MLGHHKIRWYPLCCSTTTHCKNQWSKTCTKSATKLCLASYQRATNIKISRYLGNPSIRWCVFILWTLTHHTSTDTCNGPSWGVIRNIAFRECFHRVSLAVNLCSIIVRESSVSWHCTSFAANFFLRSLGAGTRWSAHSSDESSLN